MLQCIEIYYISIMFSVMMATMSCSRQSHKNAFYLQYSSRNVLFLLDFEAWYAKIAIAAVEIEASLQKMKPWFAWSLSPAYVHKPRNKKYLKFHLLWSVLFLWRSIKGVIIRTALLGGKYHLNQDYLSMAAFYWARKGPVECFRLFWMYEL